MPKKSATLLDRVERLEEKVSTLEPKVELLAGLSGKLDVAIAVFSGHSQTVQRISERQTVLDNHVFGMIRMINPNAALDMDPPLTDEVPTGGHA